MWYCKVVSTVADDSLDAVTLDSELLKVVNRWHRTRWIAVGVLAVVLIAAAALGLRQLLIDQSRLVASCNWYRDIGTAPISVSPQTHAPSELGIRLIVDARVAWKGQGCPGALPPASPALRHWAAVFRVPGALW